MIARRTLAFSPERMRAALWQDLAIPADLFQAAIDELRSQIKATKIEYFSHHGEVTDKRVVKDNAARQNAIDKVLSMTGSYVRERDRSTSETQPVTIEIGEDGVHRIIIGGSQVQPALPPEREVLDEVTHNPLDRHRAPLELPADNGEAPEVIQRKRGMPRENVLQMFRDPEPEGNGSIS